MVKRNQNIFINAIYFLNFSTSLNPSLLFGEKFSVEYSFWKVLRVIKRIYIRQRKQKKCTGDVVNLFVE